MIDGPVLSQTDLYLLNTELELNPILAGTHGSFHLLFNVATGSIPFLHHSGGAVRMTDIIPVIQDRREGLIQINATGTCLSHRRTSQLHYPE